MIPCSTDVLVTHGPPRGILDQVKPDWEHLGDDDLMAAVQDVLPLVHVFGHIHGGAGIAVQDRITFVNASVLDEAYNIVRGPVVFTI